MVKQSEDALVNLNRLIAQNPDNTWAIAHRGECYLHMKRYEKALADFNRAIELNPTYFWAIAHRGETYRHMKRFDAALAEFKWVIDLNPNYIWAIAHRGATYCQLKRFNKALADLTRAINLKPDYAWAIAYRVQVHVPMKHYEEALVDVDRAIALDKTIVNYWRGERGLLLNYLGRYRETIESCQQALHENPNDYIALYSLAVARTLSKGLAQAEIDIDKARGALQSVVNTEERGLLIYRLGGLAALEGKTTLALNYLQEAISLSDEPIELACHDPAWLNLRADRSFQSLISETVAG